jgi:hypothetical protein
MSHAGLQSASPCIVEGVEPLLAELPMSVTLQVQDQDHPYRQASEQFVHQVYQKRYGANIRQFYPSLLGFSMEDRLRAVVGYRDGCIRPLFSEQYLDCPIEQLIAERCDTQVDRRQIVEVGNLALASAGQARWVIAAVTRYLHAAGYRWVLFTAVRPLVNAFQRLGLNPIQLADADPTRLGGAVDQWGDYYAARPVVCAGDIGAGNRKLNSSVTSQQPLLHALLQSSSHAAGETTIQTENRLTACK